MHTLVDASLVVQPPLDIDCPHCSDLLALEEGDVEDGGVEVDKLEEKHLGDETVIILSLGTVQL